MQAPALVAGTTTIRATTGGTTPTAGTGPHTGTAAVLATEGVISGTSSVPAEEADPHLVVAEAGALKSPSQNLSTYITLADHD